MATFTQAAGVPGVGSALAYRHETVRLARSAGIPRRGDQLCRYLFQAERALSKYPIGLKRIEPFLLAKSAKTATIFDLFRH